MAEEGSDRAGIVGLVALTVLTWLMVLLIQGCAGSHDGSASAYDAAFGAAVSYCTEECLPFGVLSVSLAPSPDGSSPFSCECMPAGSNIPDEQPEKKKKKKKDDSKQQRVTVLKTDQR